MACMCGDIYCWSCGPAQGNYKCHVCGAWSADGGCADPAKCAKEPDPMVAAFEQDEELVRNNPNDFCPVCKRYIPEGMTTCCGKQVR